MDGRRETVMRDMQALLGEDRVPDDREVLSRSGTDTWPLRMLQKTLGATFAEPLCVVQPRSTAEVASTLSYLSQRSIPVVPRGGGSGVSGGVEPTAQGVVVDLSRMNRILDLDEENLTVTAEAGVVLGHLEAWLNEQGYICGHYPQSIDLAQLGGLVATRSSGQYSTRYGNVEDLLLGLEAVLPSGEVVRIKSVPRRAVGPDLRQLWLGSEGSFGVVTEVTLKVFPRPADRWMQAYALPSMCTGLSVMQRFMREGWRPAVVRLLDHTEAGRSFGDAISEGEGVLLLLSEGPEGYVKAESEAVDRVVRAGGGRPLGAAPVEKWLHKRNDVSEFEKYIKMGVLLDTIEVAAGWSDIAHIYEQVAARLKAEVPELLLVMGH